MITMNNNSKVLNERNPLFNLDPKEDTFCSFSLSMKFNHHLSHGSSTINMPNFKTSRSA